MSPKSQRIALARLDGYWRAVSGNWRHPRLNYECTVSGLPDYLNDLNAIHEVEIVRITSRHRRAHRQWLERITDRDKVGTDPVTATAKQRSEAVLRTLDLWKELE